MPPGRLAVQLRDKTAATAELARTAAALRAATSRVGALFVVNAPTREALYVAVDVGADGVHVPCHTESIAEARRLVGDCRWVSTPAHTDADVTTAALGGATGVLVSPIFATPGKGPARGPEALTRARSLGHRVLIYALGGVDASCVSACARAGADGVAVIRAMLDAADPAHLARALAAPFDPT